MDGKKSKQLINCLFIYFIIADTEIPILPQTPSPPPQQLQQQPAHQQHRNVQELQQQTHQQQHPQNNGQQQQHRPLLHGLLSGTHIPQANYHRGYSSSSTGKFLSLNKYLLFFRKVMKSIEE